MTSARDEREQEPVTVRDKRRITFSPTQGGQPAASGEQSSAQVQAEAVRPGETPDAPAAGAAGAGDPSQAPVAALDLAEVVTQLGERTADLQRLKAEYDNYRRRVERDRTVSAEQAAGRVLLGLLPTLDDIARARQHGDVTGPFRAVADALETTLTTLGLERFGEQGDEFDPAVHEAVAATPAPGIGQPTCVEIFRAGYRYAGRVLRPAQVVVGEPSGSPAATPTGADGAYVPLTAVDPDPATAANGGPEGP